MELMLSVLEAQSLTGPPGMSLEGVFKSLPKHPNSCLDPPQTELESAGQE